jgi:hypothetical protein
MPASLSFEVTQATSNACFPQFRSDAGNILTLPWMCPIVVAVTQLYVQRSSFGPLAPVAEACPLVELFDVAAFVGLLLPIRLPVRIALVDGAGLSVAEGARRA